MFWRYWEKRSIKSKREVSVMEFNWIMNGNKFGPIWKCPFYLHLRYEFGHSWENLQVVIDASVTIMICGGGYYHLI